ncbi:MAG: hypothetical protein ACR2PL_16335, partial [Dehalococcoidia bacterium]
MVSTQRISGRPICRVFPAALSLVPLVFVMLSLLPARIAVAQQEPQVTVQAQLDRGHATTGDPVGLTITIRYLATLQIDTNSIESQFTPFDILSADRPVDSRTAAGFNERRLHYQVAVYHTGAAQFPVLTIPYILDGQPASAASRPLPFSVDSVIGAGDPATDIRGLKAQIDLAPPPPAPIRTIVTVVASAVALLLLLLLLWRIVRQRRNRPVGTVITPPLPPLEAEAHAELDRIVAAGLLARGDYTTHYAQMAECIRRYISRRYGFPASALTTAELNERMVRCGVDRWRARLV